MDPSESENYADIVMHISEKAYLKNKGPSDKS